MLTDPCSHVTKHDLNESLPTIWLPTRLDTSHHPGTFEIGQVYLSDQNTIHLVTNKHQEATNKPANWQIFGVKHDGMNTLIHIPQEEYNL